LEKATKAISTVEELRNKLNFALTEASQFEIKIQEI
jgi:hypothetical protein